MMKLISIATFLFIGAIGGAMVVQNQEEIRNSFLGAKNDVVSKGENLVEDVKDKSQDTLEDLKDNADYVATDTLKKIKRNARDMGKQAKRTLRSSLE